MSEQIFLIPVVFRVPAANLRAALMEVDDVLAGNHSGAWGNLNDAYALEETKDRHVPVSVTEVDL